MAGTTPSRKARSKATENEKEEERLFTVVLRVCTSSKEDFRVPMGKANPEQLANINAIINGAFATLQTNRNLHLVDEKGVGYHFNTDRITCVEVQVS